MRRRPGTHNQDALKPADARRSGYPCAPLTPPPSPLSLLYPPLPRLSFGPVVSVQKPRNRRSTRCAHTYLAQKTCSVAKRHAPRRQARTRTSRQDGAWAAPQRGRAAARGPPPARRACKVPGRVCFACCSARRPRSCLTLARPREPSAAERRVLKLIKQGSKSEMGVSVGYEESFFKVRSPRTVCALPPPTCPWLS